LSFEHKLKLNSEREERQRNLTTTPEAEEEARRVEYFFLWCLSRRVEELKKDFDVSENLTKQQMITSLLRDETPKWRHVGHPENMELGRCTFAGHCHCQRLCAENKKCVSCGHASADHLNISKPRTPNSALAAGLRKFTMQLVTRFGPGGR
jgi:hypothetical protein